MFNQAPFAINANINYANHENTWESTLSFNVTGKRLIVYQVDLPSIFLQPMAELNFTVKRQLNRNLSVRGGIENILNSPYEEQISIGNRNYYTTRYSEGRIFSISLKYTIE